MFWAKRLLPDSERFLKERFGFGVPPHTLVQRAHSWIALRVALRIGLIFGLIFGLVGCGLTEKVKVGKASPNQGIKLSLKNSSAAMLVTLLIVGLIGALSVGLSGPSPNDLLRWGLGYGLIVALILGLNRGGSAVIKHCALRLTLWLSGYKPFQFIKFLDHYAKLILLKKVGGGYIFIHRMLLEYFADLTPQSTRTDDAVKNGG
jgi:eukaryotic-like serine/threonine-protein kinase